MVISGIKTPVIFVISLVRDKQRRQAIVNQLDHCHLDYCLVDAVDGDVLTDDQINEVYREQDAINAIKRPLTKNEIGCALSHLFIYKKMVDENIEHAVILEDDALLGDNFTYIIQNLTKVLPKDWQLVLLGYGVISEKESQSLCFIKSKEAKKILNFSIKKPLSLTFCTHAYMLNKQGATRLLKQVDKLKHPIDLYTGNHKLINLYCIVPYCVEVNHNHGSAIKEQREITQEKTKKSFNENIKYQVKKFPYLMKFGRFIKCVIKIISYKVLNSILKRTQKGDLFNYSNTQSS